MGSERDNWVTDTHSLNTSTDTWQRLYRGQDGQERSGQEQCQVQRGKGEEQQGCAEVRMARNVVDKNSAKYREERERNNRAVQKTRANKREKEVETQRKIDCFKAENQKLETRIKEMDKMLSSFREIHGPMPFSS